MSTQKNNQHTYYPSSRVKAMDDFMAFAKNPKWRPSSITVDVLKMLNIAPGKQYLVIRTLEFMGLIEENGQPTNKFDALKEDYQGTMEAIVREKYSAVFDMLPEDLIDQERIVNFMMAASGSKRDTAEYQGFLFGWMCRQAGISLPKLPEKFKRARFAKAKEKKQVALAQ